MNELIRKKAIKLIENYPFKDMPKGYVETQMTKIRINKIEAKGIIQDLERQGLIKRFGRVIRFTRK